MRLREKHLEDNGELIGGFTRDEVSIRGSGSVYNVRRVTAIPTVLEGQ
jgi:hypothetical protein